MAKYLRSIQAGRYRYDYTYSKINRRDCPAARAEKKRASSRAQKAVNDKLSRLQLTAILAENFIDSPGSYFVTLTFDEAHYPQEAKKSELRAYCEKHAKNYLARLRYLTGKRKAVLRTLWAPGIGEGGRFHIHIVIDGAGPEDLRDCWGLGNVDYHSLYRDKKWCAGREWWSKATGRANPVQIARYLMQNGNDRPVGKHPWHASRNCTRPQPSPAVLIPDHVNIDPPEGSEILDKIDVHTIYSQYEAVEYILPCRPAVRAKRKGRPRR